MELLYEPAEEVAGDYYDHVLLSDGSALLWLADVAGHGIPAAMAAVGWQPARVDLE